MQSISLVPGHRILASALASIMLSIVLFTLPQIALAQSYPPSGNRWKDLAPPGFAIGGVLGGFDANLVDAPILPVVRQEFNTITSKVFMPFGPWNDPTTAIDTTGHQANIVWAFENRKRVHAHVLVYPTENVRLPWFNNLPTDEVEPVLERYVRTMASSTAGGVWVWDVVNEVIGDNGDIMDENGLRTALRTGEGVVPYREYEAMGPEYIDKAFQWAAEADPNALLIINEYSAETLGDKSDRLLALCKRLRERGVPIDGVGFQNHWLNLRYEPNYASMRANFQRFADAGFRIFITECDIASAWNRDSTPPTAAQLEQQARTFGELLTIALEQPACEAFLMWDFTDGSSWLQNTDFTLTIADRRPGMQDTVLEPGVSLFPTPFWGGGGTFPVEAKPAYFAMQSAFEAHTSDRYRITSGWSSADSYLARFGSPNADNSYSPDNEVYLDRLDEQTNLWLSLQWEAERVEPGVYRIRSLWEDVENDSNYLTRISIATEDGNSLSAQIGLQPLDPTSPNQLWRTIENGDGGVRLENLLSPFDGVLTRDSLGQSPFGDWIPGPEARLFPLEDWSSQVWYFSRVVP